MIATLLLLHLAVTMLLLGFVCFRMSKGLTLLNTFLFVFIACCCIGANLFTILPDLLPADQYSDTALSRMLVANLIFCALSFGALLVEGALLSKIKLPVNVGKVIPNGAQIRFVVGIASVCISAFLLFWLSRGQFLSNPFAAYSETGGSGQYYQYRQLLQEDVFSVAGQGTYSAKKLSMTIGPIVLVLLGYFFFTTRNWIFLGLLLIQGLLGVLTAGALAQKSFLLVAVFTPVFSIMIWRIRSISPALTIGMLIIAFFVGGTYIFRAATTYNTFEAFQQVLVRIFLIPAFVPLFYYEVIPDALPFRGLLESFYMYHVTPPVGDYAVYDVAFEATGRLFGANGNFLAVAYSGLGFYGVFMVSLICLSLVICVDFLLVRLEHDHRIVAIAFSVAGFIGITSINFLGAVENGFIIGSLAFYLLCRGYRGIQPSRAFPLRKLFHTPAPAQPSAA